VKVAIQPVAVGELREQEVLRPLVLIVDRSIQPVQAGAK
jgi:hypothetical protein